MNRSDNRELLFEQALLQAKLAVPRARTALVGRPRLTNRLGEGAAASLTFICAPAGFGKTTLACQWITEAEVDAAWVSLDEGDNEGGRMWRYIAAAIDGVRPGYLEEIKPVLSSLDSNAAEQGLIVCLNALNRTAGDGRLVLVLDDFHVIREPRLLNGISYWAEHLPSHVHLMLLSRAEPGFSMARMEAGQAALRLNADDLRFDREEGARFFRQEQIGLGDEGIAALVNKTEGWVTGLKLAALSMRSWEDQAAFVGEFAGYNRQIRQYLLEEVYARLPARLRKFLVRSSILKRWCAPLCRTVSGFEDAAALIGEIEKLQLFVVPLDAKGSWYRFHHLFEEFLRRQLEQDPEERPASLHETAGLWFRERELREEAVEHFLLGGCYDRAVGVLEEMTSRVVGWEWSHLGRWLSAIPSEHLLAHPVLFFSYANSLVAEYAGDTAKAETLLSEAEAWFDAAQEGMPPEERGQFLAMSHYVRGTIMVFGRNDLAEARKHYEKVVRYAPDGIRILFGLPETPLQPVTARTYRIGNGHAARAVAEPYTLQLAELYRAVNPFFQARLFINYAEMLYGWNDLEAAERYATEGLAWAERKPDRPEHELVPGWIVLARIRSAQARLFEACELLEAGKRRMEWMKIPRGAELLDLELRRLRLLQGDPGPAVEWGSGCRLTARDLVSAYSLYDYLLYARVLLATGSRGEAAVLLHKLLHLAQQEMRLLDAVEVLALLARLHLEEGDKQRALVQLEEALRIAEKNDFIRLLVDEGAPLQGLLADLAAAKQQGYYRGAAAASLSFVRTVLSGMDGAGAGGPAVHPFEALFTPREMDVYQGLLDGLNGKEIAARLGISYETVKTHRARIYDKLGVKNREEAVQRAGRIGG